MTGFPHPFITKSMERFAKLPSAERAKVRLCFENEMYILGFSRSLEWWPVGRDKFWVELGWLYELPPTDYMHFATAFRLGLKPAPLSDAKFWYHGALIPLT